MLATERSAARRSEGAGRRRALGRSLALTLLFASPTWALLILHLHLRRLHGSRSDRGCGCGCARRRGRRSCRLEGRKRRGIGRGVGSKAAVRRGQPAPTPVAVLLPVLRSAEVAEEVGAHEAGHLGSVTVAGPHAQGRHPPRQNADAMPPSRQKTWQGQCLGNASTLEERLRVRTRRTRREGVCGRAFLFRRFCSSEARASRGESFSKLLTPFFEGPPGFPPATLGTEARRSGPAGAAAPAGPRRPGLPPLSAAPRGAPACPSRQRTGR